MKSKVRKCISRCEFPKWQFLTPLFKVRKFSHRAKQGAKISHTSIQGEKFTPVCEIRCESPKCQFHTPLFKVQKSLLAHECHFAHLKPLFAPCETRCEIECEMQNKVWNSQFKVWKFRTMQSKVRKFRTVKFKVRKFRTIKFKVRKFHTVKF